MKYIYAYNTVTSLICQFHNMHGTRFQSADMMQITSWLNRDLEIFKIECRVIYSYGTFNLTTLLLSILIMTLLGWSLGRMFWNHSLKTSPSFAHNNHFSYTGTYSKRRQSPPQNHLHIKVNKCNNQCTVL